MIPSSLRTLLAAVLVLCASSLSATEPSAAPPPAPEWRLDDIASYRDNGRRGEVVLNARWLARTEGEAAERVVFVPGNAVVPGPKPAPTADNPRPKQPNLPQTLRRELTLPTAWARRRMTIEVGRLTERGVLRIQGRDIASIPARKRFLEFDLPGDLPVGRPLRLEIVTAGIVGDDVWLRSYPAAAARSAASLDDTFIQTSWRERRVTLRAEGRAAPGAKLELVIKVFAAGGAAPFAPSDKALMSFFVRVRADAEGRWSAEPSAPWTDAVQAWSRERPALHFYVAELRDAKGRVVDAVLPRRFGFREAWVENGHFYLNGMRTAFYCDSWFNSVATRPANNVARHHAERLLRGQKAAGLTYASAMLDVDMIRTVADELGFVGFVNPGSLVRLNVWDPRNGFTSMTGEEQVDDIERAVRRVRENPSVIFYASNSGYSQASMHPEFAGRRHEAWNFFPLHRSREDAKRAQHLFREAQRRIRELDPTRVVASHNGPYTDVDMTTRYLNNNLDRQEMADFVEDWSRAESRTAIVNSEVGVPFTAEFFLREIDFVLPQARGLRPKLYAEMGARYYGEWAYLATPDAELAEWNKTNSYASRANAVFQRTQSDNLRDIFAPWRAWGVNMATHHIQSEDGFAPVKNRAAALRYPPERRQLADARVPGLAFVGGNWWSAPGDGDDEMWPVGEAYHAVLAPRAAFLGGPDGDITDKARNYYAGETVRKAVVFSNDREAAAELSGEWRLRDAAGAVVARGPLAHRVPPGERAMRELAIEFAAPAVAARAAFTLDYELRAADEPARAFTGSAPLAVFPREAAAPPPAFAGRVWTLNISDDRTHETPHFRINRENAALLAATGLDARLVKGLRTFTYKDSSLDGAREIDKGRTLVTEGTPAPGDLLVIPRFTLGVGADERQLNVRLLRDLGLDELVAAGLRVLVLEQDLPNVLGLNTENVRPRQAFIAAPGHPVFAGLEEADLSFWRGHSTLQPAVTPLSPTEPRYPERAWQTSNRNSVATRTLLRPQVGASRALAVSGFDLQESPLLEVAVGKGRIVFCQFDVTDRHGIDPAATRLFDNLVRYLLAAPEPEPARGEVAVVAADAAGAPGAQVVAKANLIRAPKPADAALAWGVTAGELFFRESIYKHHWLATPDRSIPVFADGQVIRAGADGRPETTLAPALMETGWGKRKMLWVHAALRINQGGSSAEGPGLRHHGDLLALYPEAWVDNFVHPYTANIW